MKYQVYIILGILCIVGILGCCSMSDKCLYEKNLAKAKKNWDAKGDLTYQLPNGKWRRHQTISELIFEDILHREGINPGFGPDLSDSLALFHNQHATHNSGKTNYSYISDITTQRNLNCDLLTKATGCKCPPDQPCFDNWKIGNQGSMDGCPQFIWTFLDLKLLDLHPKVKPLRGTIRDRDGRVIHEVLPSRHSTGLGLLDFSHIDPHKIPNMNSIKVDFLFGESDYEHTLEIRVKAPTDLLRH